jgi:hypothetical protein
MSYGNIKKPDRLNTTWSRDQLNNTEHYPTWQWDVTSIEFRGGSNHVHDSKTDKRLPFQKFSFSKDGKTVRIYMGNQRTPIRRYRWVGPRGNRRKEYYILHVDRHIYQTIPFSELTYRSAHHSKDLLLMLKPNPLTYQATFTDYPEFARFTGYRKGITPVESYLVIGSGLVDGSMDQGRSQSDLSSRLPFTAADYNPPSQVWSDLKYKARQGLYEKVASRFPDVGTMVGESKETLSMLRKLANQGASLVSDLIRKDRKRLMGRLNMPVQKISSAWLTYVYGIKPLISDLESLQELPNQFGIRTYTKKATSEGKITIPFQNGGLSAWRSDFSYKLEVRTGVIMSADLSKVRKAAAMNLFNPIGVGYQLIPFSFMVDWIYDLGGYLNSESALQYGFLYGWETTTTRKIWHDYQSIGFAPRPDYWVETLTPPLFFKREWINVDRKIFSLANFPAMPTPKVDLSSLNEIKGLNALAILVQRHKAFSGM